MSAKVTPKVSVAEVERVAELAHLKLTPDESGHMLNDLNAILNYVAELNELATSGVAPLAQVSELPGSFGNPSASSVTRPDQLRPSLDRVAVLSQAPDTDQAFFKVPKVIER